MHRDDWPIDKGERFKMVAPLSTSGGPCCACLNVTYEPEDVEIENPVTGRMVSGKRERWRCKDCGTEFNRVRWYAAVVKQQQDEIGSLRDEIGQLRTENERLRTAMIKIRDEAQGNWDGDAVMNEIVGPSEYGHGVQECLKVADYVNRVLTKGSADDR